MLRIPFDNINPRAVPDQAPGTVAADETGIWIYAQAGADIDKYDCVTQNMSSKLVFASASTAQRGALVAVAPVDVKKDEWAWFQIYGRATVNSNVAANGARLLTSATDGHVDDATGSGALPLTGIMLSAAQTAVGQATCMLQFPTVTLA